MINLYIFDLFILQRYKYNQKLDYHDIRWNCYCIVRWKYVSTQYWTFIELKSNRPPHFSNHGSHIGWMVSIFSCHMMNDNSNLICQVIFVYYLSIRFMIIIWQNHKMVAPYFCCVGIFHNRWSWYHKKITMYHQ